MGSTLGYYSVLRWCPDATRDEAKNVAVLLVDSEGQLGAMRAAPISSISRRLRDQGLLDSVLVGLESQFSSESPPTVSDLRRMHDSLQHSLYLTEPQPVAVPDIDAALAALFKAHVSPRAVGSRVLTKGKVLDTVVNRLRRRGYQVRRGHYVQDFIFDVVLGGTTPAVAEVLSFATMAQNWTPVEHDAGHFLYGLEHVNLTGLAILQPPAEESHYNAFVSHERVLRWFDKAGVRHLEPKQLEDGRPLPLDS